MLVMIPGQIIHSDQIGHTFVRDNESSQFEVVSVKGDSELVLNTFSTKAEADEYVKSIQDKLSAVESFNTIDIR